MTDLTTTAADTPPALDPLALPLCGSRLIEASAGTGKTYTIAALYVRLVLGHGTTARPALLPAEILVMTFTKAATRELSHRIRGRLVAAARALRNELAAADLDDFLQGLLAAYPEPQARRHAAWQLSMAAEAMDEAAVFTIDAWCQRMLREHAFDSGSLFDEELQPNESALLAEAMADYWRQQVYPLEAGAAALMFDSFKDVAALASAARALIGQELPATAGQSLAGMLESFLAERRRLLAGWPERLSRLRQWLEVQRACKVYPFHGTRFGKDNAPGWLDDLEAWLAAGAREYPDDKAKWPRFAADQLDGLRNPKAERVPLPPESHELQALLEAVKRTPPPAALIRAHAADAVATRLQWLKQARRTFGFADLLERLHAALGEPGTEQGRALRQRIRQQYPVALIDEFQDTSPLQLSIFDKVYGLRENPQDGALLLIGDPKQSIYAFRGADIHSYLEARRATTGRHHALPRNFRSTVPMVAAVNALFLRAEQLAPDGAFRLRTPEDPGLPFVSVQAKGRDEELRVGESAIPPLTFNVEPATLSQGASRKDYAQRCAVRIASWLRGEQARFVGGEHPRPLGPADCVVLVRNGAEAREMRLALRRRGLRSVYLSEADSVFATREAADLLCLLQAIIAPRQLRGVRAALATGLVGKRLAELRSLADDEESFDEECRKLAALRETWQSRGVLAMLRELLHRFAVPARWLAATDGLGERRLTNLLQLGELLQAASQQAEGETALVHWLATQVSTGQADSPAGGADDPQILRLESDAELVRIVTIHKSKGLEYPVVFLPFATHFRETTDGNTPFVIRSEVIAERRVRRLVLTPAAEDIAFAELERHREDLRLLYVALTRARHAVWIGAPCIASTKGKACHWAKSALGHLLPAANPADGQSCVDAIRAFADDVAAQSALGTDGSCVGIESAAESSNAERLAAAADKASAGAIAPPPLLAAPLEYQGRFERHWALLSYSGLVKTATARGHESRLRAPREDEPDERKQEVARGLPPSTSGEVMHDYPGGADIGDFLHRQLEWLAEDRFGLEACHSQSSRLRTELLARCQREGKAAFAEATVAFLTRVCAAPLPLSLPLPLHAVAGTEVSLASLAAPVPEMEFWMPADGLSPAVLDQLCRDAMLPGVERPVLSGGALRGMLKGIIDLVFEHDGKFWVLDYKSNRLGPTDAHYTLEAMERAMGQHRYDVQAALYLLALHRQLRVRLGTRYSPQDHLGGALYLFMRGVNGPQRGCLQLPPPWPVIEALDRALPDGGRNT